MGVVIRAVMGEVMEAAMAAAVGVVMGVRSLIPLVVNFGNCGTPVKTKLLSVKI